MRSRCKCRIQAFAQTLAKQIGSRVRRVDLRPGLVGEPQMRQGLGEAGAQGCRASVHRTANALGGSDTGRPLRVKRASASSNANSSNRICRGSVSRIESQRLHGERGEARSDGRREFEPVS
jgi:hypothetical protein